MLFELLRRGLFFEKDGGAGGKAPDDSAEEESGKEKESDESKAGDDDNKKVEKKFSQADVDQIVKDRLERERKKTEIEIAKQKKQAEDDALTKNQEWQKLAESRAAEITTLQKEKADLEPFKEQAERYKAALDAQLTERKKTLPKFVLPLLDKMDPVEAMTYITENAEELGAKPETYDETPKGKQKKVTDEEKKTAQNSQSALVSRSF